MGEARAGDKRQRGSLFFGFFLLATQKKEARLEAKKQWCANTTQFAYPTSTALKETNLKHLSEITDKV